jgi:hypothetical protein
MTVAGDLPIPGDVREVVRMVVMAVRMVVRMMVRVVRVVRVVVRGSMTFSSLMGFYTSIDRYAALRFRMV